MFSSELWGEHIVDAAQNRQNLQDQQAGKIPSI